MICRGSIHGAKGMIGDADMDFYLNGSLIGSSIPTLTEETTSDVGNFPTIRSDSEFTIPIEGNFDALERAIFPRGYRNMRILKRDGYLSPSNAEME